MEAINRVGSSEEVPGELEDFDDDAEDCAACATVDTATASARGFLKKSDLCCTSAPWLVVAVDLVVAAAPAAVAGLGAGGLVAGCLGCGAVVVV